jgi:hypothetical protein
VIEQRRKEAARQRENALNNPKQIKSDLARVLGIDDLKPNITGCSDGNNITLETEPNLTVRAHWITKDGEGKSVNLLVGSASDKQQMVCQGACLDLYMREEGFLGEQLDLLVLLGRPPLGMWILDAVCAARWLRHNGFKHITLTGAGDAGQVIALYAGLLSDDIDEVRIIGASMDSIDNDIVGKQLRDTPYWAYRLLWVADLPQCRQFLKSVDKLK